MEITSFQREYLLRLPLPLAQLYRRAHNAKDARSRHDNVFYLFEALIKLAATPLIATYVLELRAGQKRQPKLDRLLAQLALPSLGQWLNILRDLARYFGQRPDAASHPMANLWRQLNEKRSTREYPGIVALYCRIKNGPDGQLATNTSCTISQLFDALVQYRNGVFGHGGPRFAAFFENDMGPLLAPAAGEVLAEGVFDVLGSRGSRLVFLTEIRTTGHDAVEVGLRELIGTESERAAPLRLNAADAAGLLPNVPALIWPGRSAPLRLDPLLRYAENEAGNEVLFLNRDRNGKQVEYLSYVNGATQRDSAMAADLANLLSQVTGLAITVDQLDAMAELSVSETPSVETLFEQDSTGATATRMGDYDILAEVGRGGMGVVYLARQLSLGRLVALKMLPADIAADEVALARFQREIRALARCDHPHIVKVLAGGRMPDGQLYYTMEYVPGCDLEQVWRELSHATQLAGNDADGVSSSVAALGNTTFNKAVLSASTKRRQDAESRYARQSSSSSARSAGGQIPAIETLPLPPLPKLPSMKDDPGGYGRAVVTIIRDAALALQAVHDQHVVHRDVKPANLMLTADGSRVVLMDFGLAKGQEASLTASRQGGLLGTMRYAAPEQLAAASLKVGPTADVRGLGVTLWELLTLRRLFGSAADERQLASMVHDTDVPRLRTIDPGFDRDIEAIVARATERRVPDRIQSAGQLAEYLQLYLEGKPLPIRPPSSAELLKRWVAEHRALVFSATACAVVVIAAIVWAFISITAANRQLEVQLYTTHIAVAEQELSRNLDFDRADDLLQQCQEPLRGWDWRYLMRRLDGDRPPLEGHTRGLWMAQFSPDGNQIATASCDGTVKIWDAASGSMMQSIDASPDPILPVGLPPAALKLVMEQLHHKLPRVPIMCLAYSPDGRFIASGSFAPYVTIDGLALVDPHKALDSVKSLDPSKALDAARNFNPTSSLETGKTLDPTKAIQAAKSLDSGKAMDVVKTLDPSKTLDAGKGLDPDKAVEAVKTLDPSKALGALFGDPDAPKPEEHKAVEPKAAEHPKLPNPSQGLDPTKVVEAAKTLDPSKAFDAAKTLDPAKAMDAATSLDPAKVLGAIKPVEILKGQDVLKALADPSGSVRVDAALSPAVVTLWDAKLGVKICSFDQQRGVMLSLDFSPDGHYIASSTINPDYTFVVWDTRSREIVQVVKGHQGAVHRLRFSRDGRYLASSDTTGVVKLWDAATFKEVRSIQAHTAPVIDVAFSPDSKRFATASEDGAVRIWTTDTGSRIRELTGHTGSALGVCFSPNGQLLASGGYDKTVRLWNVNTGKELITLRGHEETVWSVVFSPNGEQLLSASFDNTARVWDASERHEPNIPGLFTLKGHTDRVNGVAFSRDGRLLASSSWDNSIRLWNANTGEAVTTLQGHTAAVWGIAFSPDSTRLASAGWDKVIKIWDVAGGKEIRTLQGHTQPVHSVAFNRDGTRLVSGGWDGKIFVWDPTTGAIVTRCEDFVLPVLGVAFSPEGDRIASGGCDTSAKIWDARTGKKLITLDGHTATVCCVAFSPDGQRLVTAGWDKTIKVWDVRPNFTGDRLVFTIRRTDKTSKDQDNDHGKDQDKDTPGHTDRIGAVAFSADGKRIISGSEDKTTRVWDAATGQELLPPTHYRGPVWSVAVSPDNKRIAAACWSKTGWVKTTQFVR